MTRISKEWSGPYSWNWRYKHEKLNNGRCGLHRLVFGGCVSGEAIGDVWGMMDEFGRINDYAKKGDEEIESNK